MDDLDELGHPRQRFKTVASAIAAAEQVMALPPADRGVDLRWQAIIQIEFFVESDPEPVWNFVARWGGSDDEDLRDAVACLLLEELLRHHFELIFPRIECEAAKSSQFADMLCRCWAFGQTELPENKVRFDTLRRACGGLVW